MKNIIVLGGGFAGVRAVLTLKKKIKSHDIHITLIDKNSFHVFTPALYEVATAEESQRNIVIPYKVIFDHQVELVYGVVQKIDSQKQIIFLDNQKEYSYDYLIFALGSESEDFGISGIKEYGITLKTLEDSIRIKNSLKILRQTDKNKVVVGGGGFSGTELACELVAHESNLDVTLIQGSPILLKEMGDGVSKLARERLEKGNVNLVLGQHIKKITKEKVEVENGATYFYDVFIWTGGVRSNNLLGKIEVDATLAVKNFKNIFAAGDTIIPGVARRAEKMGNIAAENVLKSIKGEKLIDFSYRNLGYIVPLGSHFATFAMGRFYISGIFAFLIQQTIFLLYLLRIVSFFEAIKRFRKFEKDLNENWVG